VLLVVAIASHMTDGVNITIGYRDLYYLRDDFPTSLLVSELKALISESIRVCAHEIQIIDGFPNKEQDRDGWGEFLDHKRLSDYGITESKKGTVLAAQRFIRINNLIPSKQTDVQIAFLNDNSIRIPLNGQMSVTELKSLMEIKIGIPTSLQVLSDWYPNDAVNEDRGMMLDGKMLADYGYNTGDRGRIITLGIAVKNNFNGSMVIIYKMGYIQANIPFNEQDTVLQFKHQMQKITGIPQEDMFITFYLGLSKQQEEDDGVWQDWRTLYDYGLRKGQPEVLILLRKERRFQTFVYY